MISTVGWGSAAISVQGFGCCAASAPSYDGSCTPRIVSVVELTPEGGSYGTELVPRISGCKPLRPRSTAGEDC